MPIEIATETVMSLTEAAKILPRRRAGRKPHVSTLYRWAARGLKGIVLETVQVGGTTCTSREAMQRFFENLSRGRPLRICEPRKACDSKIAHAELLLTKAGLISK